MTVQQCRYVLEIAKTGSFNEAAKQLFIAQSSLSSCIKQLESELNIKIFARSNKGVILTAEGAEFVRYAGQLVEQHNFINERYKQSSDIKRLHIATQHYDFISDIFCKIVNETRSEKYHFSLREIKTYEMIREVETATSDIGILAINENDRELMERFLAKRSISFISFLSTTPYVFVNKNHPLSKKEMLTYEDLRSYSYIYYDQGVNNSSFFTEEMTDEPIGGRLIEISDRASLMNVLLSSHCYTVGTGIMPSQLNDGKIVAIPLQSDKKYSIGYILNKERRINPLTQRFIKLLCEFSGKCIR